MATLIPAKSIALIGVLMLIEATEGNRTLADTSQAFPPTQDTAKPCASRLNGFYGFVTNGMVPRPGTANAQ